MSAFRFIRGSGRSQYSVWRGDVHLGYVTKVVYRLVQGGVTRTVVSGWTPYTPARIDLANAKTREAAAKELWIIHQQGMR